MKSEFIPHEGHIMPNKAQFEELCFRAIESAGSYLEWFKKNTNFMPSYIDKDRPKYLECLLPYFDPEIMFKYKLGVVINPHRACDERNRLVYHALFVYGICHEVPDYKKGANKYFNIVNSASIAISGKPAKEAFLQK